MEVVERWWAVQLAEYGEFALTTCLPFSFLVGSYILFNLPLVVLDFWQPEFLQKYKIQPKQHVSLPKLWNCVKHLFFGYFFLMLPLVVMSFPAFQMLGLRATLPLPSLKRIVMEVASFMFIEDFLHYWFHRWLHLPQVYHLIHAVHHEYSSPFGMAASYAHPIEVLVLGMCTFAGPLLYGPHVLTFLAWIMLRQALAIETHCGYEFPFSPSKLIPFAGGSAFHDYHHKTINGNFSSNFTFWDTLFGTDRQFWDDRERRAVVAAALERKNA